MAHWFSRIIVSSQLKSLFSHFYRHFWTWKKTFSHSSVSRLNLSFLVIWTPLWKEKYFQGQIWWFSKALTPNCNMGLTHSSFYFKGYCGWFSWSLWSMATFYRVGILKFDQELKLPSIEHNFDLFYVFQHIIISFNFVFRVQFEIFLFHKTSVSQF